MVNWINLNAICYNHKCYLVNVVGNLRCYNVDVYFIQACPFAEVTVQCNEPVDSN